MVGNFFSSKGAMQKKVTFIWDTLHDLIPFVQFKKLGKTHRGMLNLVTLQTEAWNITESLTPSWVFLTFFNLQKWYQIVQSIFIWSITLIITWFEVKVYITVSIVVYTHFFYLQENQPKIKRQLRNLDNSSNYMVFKKRKSSHKFWINDNAQHCKVKLVKCVLDVKEVVHQ